MLTINNFKVYRRIPALLLLTVGLLLLAQTASGDGDGSGGGPLIGEDYEAGFEYQKSTCPEHGLDYVNGQCPMEGCDCTPMSQGEYYGSLAWGREYLDNFNE